ncbi:5-formyltetrahydrofolate cyclo-ligase [Lutibacter sp. Hel_I_33_5]|uniref:5-formyltetrahydrofolate cyclo-ligase n=1 Tax=Lutibacter sp. Hel_I_33_5 TaxID=1566289 RepID=UPI0011A00BBD|nr:5-formyltetrahydrofolate cyclo-ligase [Lutibacter sp. Hel_I_33_5]TVZ55856.1 5-formyltetrahydrofolate cyclo-ligase [Lutibacter sp. Hel_I_33_5]
MKKNTLRRIYKQKRKELTESQILDIQENIYTQFFEYDFSQIQFVHVFLSIEKQKEINTNPIIDYLLSHQKTVVVSKSDFSNNTLQHYIFDRSTDLKINTYGIPEPVNAKEIDVKEIELVIVPLLISDVKKYRVGYGKGFYDRFLSACKNEVKTVGINFFKPVEKIEDLNKFDVALDQIIYPK